ncbi:MAG: site-2 protease family protein, partial [bacterium]
FFAVYINIILAIFNSLPIPPLDGSKIIIPSGLIL